MTKTVLFMTLPVIRLVCPLHTALKNLEKLISKNNTDLANKLMTAQDKTAVRMRGHYI